MKKFYYSDGNTKYGPFTYEELKDKEINPETLIWYEGLKDWMPASKVEEMRPILELIPPEIESSKIEKEIKPTLKPITPKVENTKLENEKSGFVYKYLTYNDEYITGNQFFFRGLLAFLFSIVLIGLYMYSVAAYKRAKSLENSDSACNIWAIWGFLVVILAFTPVAFFTNTIPYWYLWWSNGPGKNKQYEIN